ncbi:hypothetical protein GCM10009837_25010 [Streptomyces durmitorensis]
MEISSADIMGSRPWGRPGEAWFGHERPSGWLSGGCTIGQVAEPIRLLAELSVGVSVSAVKRSDVIG